MMEFVPDLQKICDQTLRLDAELGVGVSLIAEDHQMMRVVYRLKELEHWGDFTINQTNYALTKNLLNYC